MSVKDPATESHYNTIQYNTIQIQFEIQIQYKIQTQIQTQIQISKQIQPHWVSAACSTLRYSTNTNGNTKTKSCENWTPVVHKDADFHIVQVL